MGTVVARMGGSQSRVGSDIEIKSRSDGWVGGRGSGDGAVRSSKMELGASTGFIFDNCERWVWMIDRMEEMQCAITRRPFKGIVFCCSFLDAWQILGGCYGYTLNTELQDCPENFPFLVHVLRALYQHTMPSKTALAANLPLLIAPSIESM